MHNDANVSRAGRDYVLSLQSAATRESRPPLANCFRPEVFSVKLLVPRILIIRKYEMLRTTIGTQNHYAKKP
jgi:hypothetical protein